MQRHRLKKLAESIDALAQKDEKRLQKAQEIAKLRRQAAVELYTVCSDFVTELNKLLSQTHLKLDPARYSPEAFKDPGSNLLQINARGRILQVEFRATLELISTEDFRVPYTLEGAVRCFNQELLEQNLIEEQLLFYCLEKGRNLWRFFDPRTHRAGPFDQVYLTSLLEQLV